MRRLLNRFRRREDGTATIQFVMLLLPVMFIFTSAFEIAMVMSRQVMVERAVAITTRELRLMPSAESASITANTIRSMICANTTVIDDCTTNTRVQMIRVDTTEDFGTGADRINQETRCVNQDDPASDPPEEIAARTTNDIMVLRVCVLQDPVFPSTGLGAQMQQHGDQYAIVALNAFTMEPE